jgi:hypothetical protein
MSQLNPRPAQRIESISTLSRRGTRNINRLRENYGALEIQFTATVAAANRVEKTSGGIEFPGSIFQVDPL